MERLSKKASERKRQILDGLAGLFGKETLKTTGYYETDWGAEKYTAGCVSPLEPGVLTKYGASLRPPVGRIHWAGTETAERWTGYMDGAVRAGKRVALEVAKELGRS
jgi:monoamine oxidase